MKHKGRAYSWLGVNENKVTKFRMKNCVSISTKRQKAVFRAKKTYFTNTFNVKLENLSITNNMIMFFVFFVQLNPSLSYLPQLSLN